MQLISAVPRSKDDVTPWPASSRGLPHRFLCADDVHLDTRPEAPPKPTPGSPDQPPAPSQTQISRSGAKPSTGHRFLCADHVHLDTRQEAPPDPSILGSLNIEMHPYLFLHTGVAPPYWDPSICGWSLHIGEPPGQILGGRPKCTRKSENLITIRMAWGPISESWFWTAPAIRDCVVVETAG